MRILIIGGTGFTGPYVVCRLAELGHELLLYHRGQTEADLPAGIRQINGDRWHLADHAAELARFVPQIVLDMIPRSEQDAWTVRFDYAAEDAALAAWQPGF